MNDSNFFIDCLSEFEGVESLKGSLKLFFSLFGDVFGLKNSLIRGFGRVVVFNGSGADAQFVLKLDGGQKKVLKEPPFVFVKII